MMGELYLMQSEKATWINLESPVDTLELHLDRLYKQAGKIILDVSIIKEAIHKQENGGEIL